VRPLGPKIAEGRDSEIFDHGPGKVLRLARDGRSLVREAEVMRYAHGRRYPVPEVYDAGDGYLVMARVDGPTMIDAALRRPTRIGGYGRLLARLHEQLHAIEAPDGLPAVPVSGDRLLHRDLHPLNVLLSADGPVVIDWANAAKGDPAYDVADTWVLFATAEAPGGPLQRAVAALGRRTFLRHVRGSVDTEAARRVIPAAVENRLVDRNMTDAEKHRLRRMAQWAPTEAGKPPYP
jgi:aminoglycoside phosphotransferase (APT) family kinase protein